jgi:hypothetical protein
MVTGFIILRHVRHRMNDYYWKESYRSIRRWYPDAPIMIVDDSSDPAYLQEDLIMTRCTVIYDKQHRGAGEILPYYYFHKLHPFDRAVILHDAAFLQAPIRDLDTSSEEIRWLWSIPHNFDYTIAREIHELMSGLTGADEIRGRFEHADTWDGAFGVMSVISWDFLNRMEKRFSMFDTLPKKLVNREYRSALERLIGVLAHQLRYEEGCRKKIESLHGDIFQYITWGVSFIDYLLREDIHDAARYPIMKVWSGR